MARKSQTEPLSKRRQEEVAAWPEPWQEEFRDRVALFQAGDERQRPTAATIAYWQVKSLMRTAGGAQETQTTARTSP